MTIPSLYKRSFATLTIFLISLAACSQTARAVASQQKGVFNGQPINYWAIVKEFYFSPDSGGSVAASAITTSYIKENATMDRPVVFVFNGGPGASSSPLHMNALGPWRIKPGKDSATLIENQYSLLDLADLVFIDPPGTGFTKVLDKKAAGKYWDVKGDAQLFIELVKKWKVENNRAASPVFLCGESYGTTRATAMMGLAKDLKISGAILLSSVFDLTIINPAPGNDMPYVLYLPGMAAVAYYHKKADKKITSPEQAYEEGVRFALDEYIAALAKGVSLSQKEKEKIATKLAGLIGLSKEIILEKDLRITPKDFQLLLLAKEEKRVGQLNGQITGPLHNPGAKPPFDDPSMSMGPSTRGIVGRYFKQNLLFPDTGTYRTLNLDVNSAWNWTSMEEDLGYLTVAGYLPKVLKEQPHLNLLVAGGYYDLATPIYAARYILEHVGVKADRVTYANFPTGHSIFEKEEELKRLTELVKWFILMQNKK
jgi:carboxypeptidase C (cathepsin A)